MKIKSLYFDIQIIFFLFNLETIMFFIRYNIILKVLKQRYKLFN